MSIIKHEVIRAGKPTGFAGGVAVLGAKGFVFLSGCTGIDEKTGITPLELKTQVQNTWGKIIERLEGFGSSVENICHAWTYVVGSFPNGINNDPKAEVISKTRREVWEEHYGAEIAEKLIIAGTLIGVTALARPEMLVEIQVIAAIE